MPVFRGSRYENVKFTGILGEDGKVRRYLHTRDPLTLEETPDPIIVRQYQRGEVLDQIAFDIAAKSRLWWSIADISGILFPLEIEPGTELSIPLRFLIDQPELS
jgi:hypothetical protein